MKILSGEQAARLDRLSIRRHGLSGRLLMQRAAVACCEILRGLPGVAFDSRLVIVCGPGNNGGDGLAMAAQLQADFRSLSVFLLADPARLSDEAKFFYEAAKGRTTVVRGLQACQRMNSALRKADFVVDALFGIGLSRPLTGDFATAVRLMNASRAFKLAVDIPSGISAENGAVFGVAFRADLTVSFEAPKWGLLLPQAWDYVGELKIRSIGLSRAELRKIRSRGEWITADEVRSYFKPRARTFHKGKAGRVLVVAGSVGMPGAGYLAARSALRAGAGTVTWALPESAYGGLDLRHAEVMLRPLPAEEGVFGPTAFAALERMLADFDAVAVGPGLGRYPGLLDFVKKLWNGLRLPAVWDADALALLARLPPLVLRACPHILTPHPKEMAGLCGTDTADILSNRVKRARTFARRRKVYVVLKGYRSLTAEPNGKVNVNSSGGPNLATAGSGDVLTGMIAAFLAQGFSRRAAALSAVYIHGRVGDACARLHGDRGTLASDLIEGLPAAIRCLTLAEANEDDER